MTQRGDLVPAPVYWWTEQEYNIEEKDVRTLAKIEVDKVRPEWSEEKVEERIEAALRECRFRQQGVYGHIRKTGRKGPSWPKFMKLIIEGVDCVGQDSVQDEEVATDATSGESRNVVGHAWPFQ